MYQRSVSDITWEGHDFLDSIRADNIWEATKKGANKLKTMSLTSVKLIAGQILHSIISNQRVIDAIVKEILQ